MMRVYFKAGGAQWTRGRKVRLLVGVGVQVCKFVVDVKTCKVAITSSGIFNLESVWIE